MDWWNFLIFGAIPVLTVVIVFFVKRRFLWTAPVISAALAFIAYAIAHCSHGISMKGLFSNNEWTAFFVLAMLLHLGIVIVLTLIAYLLSYILKRRQM